MSSVSSNLTLILLTILVILAIGFLYFFLKDFFAHKDALEKESGWVISTIVGFVVNFFDTLGIGSFAPTTSLLKVFRQIADKAIPGTLNVSCAIPVILEALIFITVVEMDPVTLFSMLIAAAVGAYFGAGIIARMSEQKIRLVMGVALLATAFLMLAGMMNWMPVGGEAQGLEGGKLIFGVVANLILGVLMTAGIGLYAPCMALVYLLGMSPLVSFPIMMGSCAMLMPVASYRFIKESAYNRKISMAFLFGGVPSVFVAAYLVKSMPLDVLRWLVVAVVLYTSYTLLHAYRVGRQR